MTPPIFVVVLTVSLLGCVSCSGRKNEPSRQEGSSAVSELTTPPDNPSHEFKTSFGYVVRPILPDAEVVASALAPTYDGIICERPKTRRAKNGAWYFEFFPGDFRMDEVTGKLLPVWVPKLEAASSDYRVGYWVFEHRDQLRVAVWATGGVEAGGRAGPMAMDEDVKHRFGGYCE